MKPIKIIHTGDGHYSRENQEPFFKSASHLLEKARKEEPDLIVIAGDLFDRAVNDTTGSGFPRLVCWMKSLMDIAPVVAVRGTPTHDPPGCYEVFETIQAQRNFTLLTAWESYFLDNFGVQTESNNHARLLILGLPEPSKEWFLKDKQLGKTEGDEAIKEGIRELLLGMGAIRKQYPEIPCILVSHITVAGSSISDAQILPPGGIQIGKDDLALVGADYYALGHIHLGQQIEDMPAYYCGSMFPVNWGELDQKGFNIVEFDDYVLEVGCEPVVQRIPFPHPPRKKIVFEYGSEITEDVDGFQVWVECKGTKEQLRLLDIDERMDELLSMGACSDSRITKAIIPTETVRAGQISEAVSLVDKLKVYADLSGETLNDSTIERAADLETTARKSGEIGEGLHIRVQKLVIRGAIGIKKGLGLDEIEIDLDQYEPGLIALVGVNGAGKSTLIENMHPYPQLLTRTGKLQDHFCLRDSFRDLYFTDERTGTEYRAFISIDGQNKSGSCEYFLNRKEDEEYVPASKEFNGRKDPYVAEIGRLFGSIELYLRSAFVSQKQPKNLPDLSDATPGEKKALFRELGGLDYLEVYSKAASETAKVLEGELITIKAKLEREDEIKDAIGKAKGDLNAKASCQEETEDNLALIKEKGEGLKADHDRLKVIVDKNADLYREGKHVQEQINSARTEKEKITGSLEEYRSALEGKEQTEKLIKEYEDLKAEEAKLNEEKSKHEGARARGLACYNELRDTVAEQERNLCDKKSEAEKAAQAVERERDLVLADANNLEKELTSLRKAQCPILQMECPAKDHESFQSVITGKNDQLSGLALKAFDFDKALTEKNKAIKVAQKAIDDLVWPDEPKVEEYDDTRLSEASVKLSTYDIENIKDAQDRAQEAEVRIQEGEKQLKALEATFDTLNERVADLQHQISEESETEYRDVAKQLEETRQQYIETDKEITRLNTEIEGLKKQIAEREAELEDLKALDEERKAKEIDLTEWQYLQRACGPNGIQALELDAMGPDVALYANQFLEVVREYPDSHFDRIEFKTQHVGGQGSNTRMIEDFLIMCHDVRDDDWTALSLISVGESVWVKRSMAEAFGIVRANKEGTHMLTGFQDESDAALDPAARSYWVKMLELAHQQSHRHQTILITHSPEVQEMIGQKIEMTALKEAVREGVLI